MITIVDYGDACVLDVASALREITSDFVISKSEADIYKSDKIIFAGSGSAVAVMKKIQLLNLYSVLRLFKKPMLGIGLGMQLMADYSTEGNFPCLGLFPGTAIKFDEQINELSYKGFHQINFCKSSILFNGIGDKSEFFFNNSYYLPKSEFSTSTCQMEVAFCASIENKNAYGVQFHPEASGAVGLKLLKNFVEM